MANPFFLSIARAMPQEAERLGITVEALAELWQSQQAEMDREGTAGKYSGDRGVLWVKDDDNAKL